MVGIPKIFSAIQNAGSELGFTIAFNAMQATVTNRANAEIEKVVASDKTADQLKALDKARKSVNEKMPSIETFLFAATGNQARLDTLENEIADLALTMKDGQEVKNSLTADEAATLNEGKAAIVEKLRQVQLATHPDITSGTSVARLRQLADELEAMGAEEGAIDADGDAATNGNRAFYEKLVEVQNAVTAAATVNEVSRDQASELKMALTTKMLEIEADGIEITEVNAARVAEEIDAIKLKYANTLKMISLSYEVNKEFTNYLSNQLGEQRPAAGSVLNLFR